MTGILPGQVPLEPTGEQARQWAIEELSRREYAVQRPSALSQVLDAIGELLGRLLGAGAAGGTGTAAAIVVGIVVVLVAVAVTVGGRVARRARQTAATPVFGTTVRSAAAHRAAADEAAGRADWQQAVVERFRAVVRELEERAVLAPQPGRTADEAATEAARWVPDLGPGLAAAARLFDDVRYGDRPADAGADAGLRRLDEQVRAARLRLDPGPAPVSAVPS